MPYNSCSADRIRVFPLAQRRNLLHLEKEVVGAASAEPPEDPKTREQIERLAEKIRSARREQASVMLTYGAHLIKNGAGPLVNDLIEAGWLTHLATQGAGIIHDWEFAFQGASGESVRENAPAGTFGTWDETGRWLNLAALVGAALGLGLGESVGRMIAEDRLCIPLEKDLRRHILDDPAHPLAAPQSDLLSMIQTYHIPSGELPVLHPFKACSVPATAYRHHVPMTVHPGIGYDIITNHPLYHGGAIGRAATTDARIFAASVDRLDGGVYISVGSAIMSPQVFEKAFSLVNNLRADQGRPRLQSHSIVIVDLQDGGGWDWTQGEPPPSNPAYYLRFCKSFYRMGGSIDYVRCDNRAFLAHLMRRLDMDPTQALCRLKTDS